MRVSLLLDVYLCVCGLVVCSVLIPIDSRLRLFLSFCVPSFVVYCFSALGASCVFVHKRMCEVGVCILCVCGCLHVPTFMHPQSSRVCLCNSALCSQRVFVSVWVG
eukprot:Opistho-2@46501